MSAHDNAYLVPVEVWGENNKVPWREEARKEGRGQGFVSRISGLKPGRKYNTKGRYAKWRVLLYKRSSATNSLSARFIILLTPPWFTITPLFILIRSLYNNALSLNRFWQRWLSDDQRETWQRRIKKASIRQIQQASVHMKQGLEIMDPFWTLSRCYLIYIYIYMDCEIFIYFYD